MVMMSKQQSTRARLEEIAHEVGAGGQMPPIRQLGSDLGVSLSTLNAALAELEDRNVIRRRQGSGIFVSPSLNRRNLCLLCDPGILLEFGTSPVWSLLVEAARRRAGDLNEDLSIHFAQISTGVSTEAALHERLARDIAGGNVHGVLSIGLPHALTRWIEGCGVPVVAFAGAADYFVWMSGQEMIAAGVDALARQGCRALALWSPLSARRPEPPAHESVQAFRDALDAHGLPYQADLSERFAPRIDSGSPWTQSSPGQGFDAMSRVAGGDGPRPDGIVSTDDMLTQGLLMAMGRHGLCVGRDIHVATQSNRHSPALLGWERAITRIEYDPAEIVSAMFDALEALLRGETPVGATPVPDDPSLPDYHPPEKHLLVRPRIIPPEERAFPPPEPCS